MAQVDEKLTAQFHQWEQRGRGWRVFDKSVSPEPPFRPFFGHYLPSTPAVDDGRRSTALSSMVRKIGQTLSGQQPVPPVIPASEEEPEPEVLTRDSLVELQASLPATFNITREAFEHFLLNLSLCREPITFELLGVPQHVTMQFAAHPADAPLIRRQLQAHFPEGTFQSREGALANAWDGCEGDDALAVEFGLAQEFMLPLATGKLDPFIGIVGALAELQPNELGLFQVLFRQVEHPWADNILRSVTREDGTPFFVNMPELVAGAKNKIGSPLYAAVVRIAVKTGSFERTLQIARDLAASLRVFANPQGNELIPLENSDYPFEEHIEDVLRRQSRRCGMLLSSDELTGFVHLPSSAVRSPALQRETGKTKAAPAIVRGRSGVLLGYNPHGQEDFPVRLTAEQRVRHCHVIGASGTGKSTLLYNLICQDIKNGEGVAVLDPHGDLIDRILGSIPKERIDDVILVDPSDEQFSVGFNILSAHSDLEKTLLASDLVSVFQRLSSSWGDQMGSVLQNAILAFLESDQGGTLADLRRFLIEPAFRDKFLKTVRDPDIVYYWRKGFTQLSGNKSIGPALTRLETFLSPKPIRYMVSQPVNRLDFGQIIDTGKIFLAKLPQGQMGKENAFLLGSLLVSKFQQLAMSRQAQRAAARKDFWLYIDEFQNFITPSMTEILTGARKYRMGLVLAHQELRQLERDREVSSAVLSNTYTRVVFRVGDADARALESGFSFFEARDIQNLETGQAICRVEKSDGDFNLTVPFPEDPEPREAEVTRQAVVAASRAKYATPRAEVEAVLLTKVNLEVAEPAKTKLTPSPIPKVVEVEKPAVPEKKEAIPGAPTIPPLIPKSTASQIQATPRDAEEEPQPRDLGRGGAQHQAIQKRIKAAGEAIGFRCTIEKEISQGGGSIDVFLEHPQQTIACEISITTTVDHEVGNVLKCLHGGYPHVVVVSANKEHLKKIKVGVEQSAGPSLPGKVEYLAPDEFIANLTAMQVAPEADRVRRGYKLKRSIAAISAEERAKREERAISSIAEAMRTESVKSKRKT